MTPPVFSTVLVANRGEIARRVIRTLRRLGIRSVAVYSDADVEAPHVREADTAVRLGPAPAAQSYLDIDAVIAAARATGAQAVHPGYGFLSENAHFARACAAAGIVFVGPGEHALDVMGDKIRAKQHVARSGVPTVPGFSAAGMTDEAIVAAAVEQGFPLLIKPSAGGGGKGMQVVRDRAGVAGAVQAARRMATAAFGDDTLLLERLVERPRHIEVQVLADAHGAVVHLGERECSLQRRHQKVIEEAPSPAVDDETRARLGEAACRAAASIDYVGVGTVEFLVSADRPDDFFFIEMNTRLQVEHPVTELVTGIDLVAEQLRVAAGEPLGYGQDAVGLQGHAVEARVYAESPARGFLPATGEVLAWRAPEGVRVDAAVDTGSVVTADYDPMIAKVIAVGADRAEALERLDAALAETVVLGVDTNIAFLRQLIALPAVQAGDLDTGIIDAMAAPGATVPGAAVLAAGAAVLADAPSDASPWQRHDGWRLGGRREPASHSFETDAGTLVTAVASPLPPEATTARDGDGDVWVHLAGETARLRPVSRRAASERRRAARGRTDAPAQPHVRAPLPGTVIAVHTTPGAAVAAADRLVTIEAMKMEHTVIAPHDGVAQILVTVGAQVRRDDVLAEVHPMTEEDTP
ncbi:ATP-grasp domain-containing protein [Microbacterium sp. zg.Y1090]|uniref:ATP-binding protein n=1 Tax=Microbacterium TaxID=33882 RepID=UPI00214C53EE|nr:MULTISPECIES: biotin carboxylase N-terminal domain-containing protein [unclassified Microbacterium]MCR2811979.1 ATP-grasp domain-containing protein [Microbacterium sp. zg.Y1084]MCR2818582.1 ATP-grasp domain-containing protein [Microbacterium sp. zg.Y1090]MDL5486396.1 biotin carboxylase N-terminal domain-containing protein [Microbacterium sp. zg-Y1211]WIM29586.1 biotin carboxylase N-terminal domain-containing protein [Microbacterium sp. zg-Y1090]